MRKGYLNLADNLRILTEKEVAKDIDYYELQIATGRNLKIGHVIMTLTDIFAQEHDSDVWHQIPIDELVGLAVVFLPSAKSNDLPVILADAKTKRDAVRKTAAKKAEAA